VSHRAGFQSTNLIAGVNEMFAVGS